MPDNDYQRYLAQRQAMVQAIRAQATPEPEQPTESDRAHLFTGAAAVLLPIAQAITTGALCGAAAAIYAWLLKSPTAWRWGIGVAVGVAVLVWIAMLARWLDLTRPLERIVNRDINGDGFIGQPPRQVVRVEVKSEDGKRVQYADLPTSQEKMADFARGVLGGTPISERHWSGAGALFSQNEFREIRDLFIARGFMRWANPEYPQQGTELTPAGRSILKTFASDTTSPTPPRAERD